MSYRLLTETKKHVEKENQPHKPKKKSRLNLKSLDDFDPKRFGISYEPPMVILEYMIKSKGTKITNSRRKIVLEKIPPPQNDFQNIFKGYALLLQEKEPGVFRTWQNQGQPNS
jgi:hypothetical protein